jgi:hypothetical protein
MSATVRARTIKVAPANGETDEKEVTGKGTRNGLPSHFGIRQPNCFFKVVNQIFSLIHWWVIGTVMWSLNAIYGVVARILFRWWFPSAFDSIRDWTVQITFPFLIVFIRTGCSILVTGDTIPHNSKDSFIIAPNHQSVADSLLITLVSERSILFVKIFDQRSWCDLTVDMQ